VTIHEGRNRQVRRMLEAVGHRVTSLQRISYGPLELGAMGQGTVRRLTPAEVATLRHTIGPKTTSRLPPP